MSDLSSVPKIGVWAWSFVGFVVATIIIATALGAVSEIVLPLLFAAVLAVVFKPLVRKLERRGLKPTLAAGVVVLGLLALMTVVFVATATRAPLVVTASAGSTSTGAVHTPFSSVDTNGWRFAPTSFR